MGGRYLYDDLFKPESWSRAIDEAIAQASVNLRSVAAPAGEMTVLLGPGWPGVLLHEAVGHGLEGDFNRKGTSAFSRSEEHTSELPSLMRTSYAVICLKK